MTQQLHFAEAATLQDLGTYVKRARRIQEQGIRLQAVGSVLAAWVPVMTPSTLTSGVPAVLGLRTMALAEPTTTDATVELGSISERLARLNPAEVSLPLPPSRINAPWAAVTPPRSGWEAVGAESDQRLREAADAGITEIAQAVPTSAGAHVVEQVREKVWGRPLVAAGIDIPAGAAFGALSLGFLSGEEGAETQIHRLGRWLRLSSAGGFILCRMP
ncbi:hypothetical protein M3B43_07330 [Nesterenkonia massiliensis]|uniref:Uncharacterized protein n=1 Tax=Nesterenkonia massiliensis TaxID=1232429 RepID=A0ABT2HR29_9MICC|nr:hypothetical protein [Nesterenkonia massiliensis]MCT1607139.1 hypothetical protein [Nesterenkonia massiliensis]